MNGAIEFSYHGLSLKCNPETGQCWKKPRGMWWKLIQPGISRGYTVTRIGGSQVRLHRIVAEVFLNGGKPLTIQQDVDHIEQIDGSHAQDRLSNLRICSRSQNLMNQAIPSNNTSGYKGVSLNKRDGKWQAHISISGRQQHIGYFTTPEAAALAYDNAAKKLHGEFAKLNFT